ncbi:GNAT family N-acetyltransferase [Streptomyces odontomachi]|uniref:GNAT family N-acetyltransferase n=1 Tax=Streptomyces odontomachi TaxID=2944940 RepID=UPI00210B3C6F|nr:GNAT family N-acetyltransferase [Streptomyces sp. ODS25]
MEISRATVADAEVIATILNEIQEYYGDRPAPQELDQIKDALFGERPLATVLLARDGAEVLGFASYTLLWPASGAHTSLYLKELFVRAAARRRGVARALMAALREAARDAGCTRIEWTADTDNPPALALYEALGAAPLPVKVFYRTRL